jgi:hypothetical protein
VIYKTIGNGRRVYLVSWGAPHSEFLFSVKAESPDARKALVQAFVEGASSPLTWLRASAARRWSALCEASR